MVEDCDLTGYKCQMLQVTCSVVHNATSRSQIDCKRNSGYCLITEMVLAECLIKMPGASLLKMMRNCSAYLYRSLLLLSCMLNREVVEQVTLQVFVYIR